ncbi:zinc dependent phospholipase C family protein [Anoxynatronum buryatiense]|nr:zinc dependent phospholipase C family protein [Anoxynatronum buryatiense]
MPSLITHCQCVKEALESFSGQKRIMTEAAQKHPQMIMLGAQGGDPFFYEGVVPWEKRLHLRTLGEKMHEHHIRRFFSEMLASLKDGEALFQLKLAYILGYLAHYALDTHTHPFIFYWSGFAEDPGDPAQQYRFKCDHSAYEKALDLFFVPNAHQIPLHRWIQPPQAEMQAMARWLAPLLHHLYDIPVSPKGVMKSARDMQLIYRLLLDRTGWKRRMTACLEGIFRPPGYMTANIYPQKMPGDEDVLNEGRKPWCLPWDQQAVSRQNFMELYQEAVRETVELWQAVEDWLEGRNTLEGVLEKIGNRSFSTGIDCQQQVVFRYRHQQHGAKE